MMQPFPSGHEGQCILIVGASGDLARPLIPALLEQGAVLGLHYKHNRSVLTKYEANERCVLLQQDLGTESDWLEPPLWFYPAGDPKRINLTPTCSNSTAVQYDGSDKYILDNFGASITEKEKPLCDAEDGLKSVAVLDACKLSCETGQEIYLKHIW